MNNSFDFWFWFVLIGSALSFLVMLIAIILWIKIRKLKNRLDNIFSNGFYIDGCGDLMLHKTPRQLTKPPMPQVKEPRKEV